VAWSFLRIAILGLAACAYGCDDEEGYPPNAPGNDMTEVAPATPQQSPQPTSSPSQPPPGTPQPLGEAWVVPFPAEATQAGVASAEVVLLVTVSPSGAVEDAAVMTDPGHGFGEAARRYALGQRFKPAVDASGTAIRASTRMRVRFHAQSGAAPATP
jgi:protein TonB